MRPSLRLLRAGFLALVSLPVVAIVSSANGVGCIPDPKGEFDDYNERTANLQPTDQPTADAATFDSKPPEVATEALYAGICVTSLAARDPEQALRFYTESKYVPEGDTGKLTLTLTPLLGWDKAANAYTSPATVSKSETRGAALVAPTTDVAANGRFTINAGTINLPGEANSVSGRDAVIERVVLDGRFGQERFCATLGGLLTIPYSFTFDPKQNTCLFIKVKDGDPLPKLPSADFVCPL